MKIKYNRVSTILQSGNRFEADTDTYDLTLLDKVRIAELVFIRDGLVG